MNTIVESEKERNSMRTRLEQYLEEQRIKAQPNILLKGERNVYATIRSHSHDADLVVCGLRHPGEDETQEEYQGYYRELLSATSGFPPTAFVLSAERISFARLFETGVEDVN